MGPKRVCLTFPVMQNNSSVAVILNTRGTLLSVASLRDIPRARVVRAEVAAGESATCVAATLEHECSLRDLSEALRSWAAGRGWSVTVAPLT
jgi:hypothetical protein